MERFQFFGAGAVSRIDRRRQWRVRLYGAPRLPRCVPEKPAAIHADRLSPAEDGRSWVEVMCESDIILDNLIYSCIDSLSCTDFCPE